MTLHFSFFLDLNLRRGAASMNCGMTFNFMAVGHSFLGLAENFLTPSCIYMCVCLFYLYIFTNNLWTHCILILTVVHDDIDASI